MTKQHINNASDLAVRLFGETSPNLEAFSVELKQDTLSGTDTVYFVNTIESTNFHGGAIFSLEGSQMKDIEATNEAVNEGGNFVICDTIDASAMDDDSAVLLVSGFKFHKAN